MTVALENDDVTWGIEETDVFRPGVWRYFDGHYQTTIVIATEEGQNYSMYFRKSGMATEDGVFFKHAATLDEAKNVAITRLYRARFDPETRESYKGSLLYWQSCHYVHWWR